MPLPPEMRPDRIQVVFAQSGNGDGMIAVRCDPSAPDAWHSELCMAAYEALMHNGATILIGNGKDRWVAKNGAIRKADVSAPDENGVEWFLHYSEDLGG